MEISLRSLTQSRDLEVAAPPHAGVSTLPLCTAAATLAADNAPGEILQEVRIQGLCEEGEGSISQVVEPETLPMHPACNTALEQQ